MEESTPTTAVVTSISESDIITSFSLQELQDAQLNDTTIGDILREIEKGLDSPLEQGRAILERQGDCSSSGISSQ